MDGGLVGNFQLDPSWGIRTDFFSEILKGIPLKCEMGVRWGQGTSACLEVMKPRLGAHADQDPRAKQGDLLLDI